MIAKVRELPLEEMGVTNTIKAAIKIRLMYIAPYLQTWPQAMSIGAIPSNVPHTLHAIASMSDDIWHRVGDKSTDINWYTKRGLIGGVYVATELFMLTDKSPEYVDTWDFLERRLQDVMMVGGAIKESEHVLNVVATGFQAVAMGLSSVMSPVSSSKTTSTKAPSNISEPTYIPEEEKETKKQ